MYISKFRVQNYKSFLDSGDIELKQGINVIVGKNNAGKTAFLEALSFANHNEPHKSLKNVDVIGKKTSDESKCILSIKLTNNDMVSFFQFDKLSIINNKYSIAKKKYDNNKTAKFANILVEVEKNFPKEINNMFFGQEETLIKCIRLGGNVRIQFFSCFGNYNPTFQHPVTDFVIDKKTGKFVKYNSSQKHANYRATSISKVNFASRIFCFRAERLNISSCSIGVSSSLRPNASNLAEVLSQLQANPNRFKRFNSYINKVFPNIHWISVHNRVNNNCEIMVWTIEYEKERHDLTVPLSKCGSGVSQVLAMLYVLMTSEFPQVIIIDEPQSFLHPSAIRKLLEIFKEFPQHQYIIATHSPTIIAASDPSTIHLLEIKDSCTEVMPIDINDTKQLRRSLLSIGARLSDVFGADSILWVEGETEEIAYKMIIRKILKQKSLMGMEILSVLSVDDLTTGKDRKKILKIYNKLCKGNGLIPPSVCFLFDRETQTIDDIKNIEQKTEKKIRFLRKRMYENYLLNFDVICKLMNQINGFSNSTITPTQLNEWISENKDNKEFWKGIKDNNIKDSEDWTTQIDAAKFLERIFAHFSETRVEYRKTTHSILLTEMIIKESAQDLQEIADLLNDCITEHQKLIEQETSQSPTRTY